MSYEKCEPILHQFGVESVKEMMDDCQYRLVCVKCGFKLVGEEK